MAKLPAFQFYVGDWRKDPGVQSLSFNDRGIWFELLCLMHESEQRGRLMLNGKPISPDQLSRLLGLDKQAITKAIHALYEAGVCSKCTTTGALMCRRMVRDETERSKRKACGSTGGNPLLCDIAIESGFVYLAQRSSDGAVKIGSSRSPEKRIYRIKQKLGVNVHLVAKAFTHDMGRTEGEVRKTMGERTGRTEEWFTLSELDFDLCRNLLVESDYSPADSPTCSPGTSPAVHLKVKPEDEDEESGVNERRVKPKAQALFEAFDFDGGFAQFWNKYRHKVGKPSARKAWESKIRELGKRLGHELAAEKLLLAVDAYFKYLKESPRPPSVKQAAGWINDDRFEVDYDDLLRGDMSRASKAKDKPRYETASRPMLLDTP